MKKTLILCCALCFVISGANLTYGIEKETEVPEEYSHVENSPQIETEDSMAEYSAETENENEEAFDLEQENVNTEDASE